MNTIPIIDPKRIENATLTLLRKFQLDSSSGCYVKSDLIFLGVWDLPTLQYTAILDIDARQKDAEYFIVAYCLFDETAFTRPFYNNVTKWKTDNFHQITCTKKENVESFFDAIDLEDVINQGIGHDMYKPSSRAFILEWLANILI